MPGPAADLIERAIAELRLAIPAGADGLIAIGWATVELDRAAAELASAFGRSPADFAPAPDSETLGARCRVAGAALAEGVVLALVEPASEGRLAATLARFGEGPRVAWYVAGEDVGVAGAASARPGPFGLERLIPGGRARGPDRFLVTTEAGTIDA